jgi:lysophospholipase L1-like esterase
MRPAVRTIGVVAAVAVAVVAGAQILASCSAVGGENVVTKDQPVDATSVVILGDSLSAQTNEEFTALMPGVTIDAFPGRTLVTKMIADTGMDRVATLKALNASWWVVALGTNDASYAAHTEEQMAADVATILDAIGPDQCVLWVLPAIGAPAEQAWIDNVGRFREIAKFAMGSRICGSTIDWSAVLAAESGILKDDGIHLTSAGEQRLAKFVLEGLLAAGAFNPVTP